MSGDVKESAVVNWSESYFIKSLMAGITMLTAFINLILAITKLVEGKNIIAIIAMVGCVVFFVLSIVLLSLRAVQRSAGIKTEEDYEDFVRTISSVTHNLLHRIRNSIYYMEDKYDKQQYTTERDFEQYITLEILQLVDLLANELTKILKKDVRVCIKCLKYTNLNEDEIDKMNLVTFARSGLKNIDEIMQEHLQPISIEENTDFLEIVQSAENSRQRQYFYEKNLKQYAEKLRKEGKVYKNSNSSWENDYITTIVCPIRLKRATEQDNNLKLECDLIGFLCVDSLDEEAFCNQYSDFCFDLLKGVADIMYVYLDKFIEYYSIIKGELNQNA